MEFISIQQRIDELTKILKEHNYNYYILSNPTISDYEFDHLLKELENLEDKYPQFKKNDSPTQKVGGDITKNFQTVKHAIPLLSLGNTYNREELIEFDNRVKKGLGINQDLFSNNQIEYICELKFDGLSISLIYDWNFNQSCN